MALLSPHYLTTISPLSHHYLPYISAISRVYLRAGAADGAARPAAEPQLLRGLGRRRVSSGAGEWCLNLTKTYP